MALAAVAAAMMLSACASPLASPLADTSSPGPTIFISPAATDPSAVDFCLTGGRTEIVRLRASDGVPIVGAVLGSGSSGVVLAHQGDATLCDWLFFARTLVQRGYVVMAIDHRGFGASGSNASTRYDLDVVAAGQELRRRGARDVVLLGSSLGALAVLAAGGELDPPPAGVIAMSAPGSYGDVDALRAVPRLRAPVLFLVSEGDVRFVPAAKDLFAAAGSADKRLETLKGFDHGTDLLQFDQSEKVERLLLEFLDRHLPASG
jgi:alpha-beta hydrolase superfamily lysophospholipase